MNVLATSSSRSDKSATGGKSKSTTGGKSKSATGGKRSKRGQKRQVEDESEALADDRLTTDVETPHRARRSQPRQVADVSSSIEADPTEPHGEGGEEFDEDGTFNRTINGDPKGIILYLYF